jgi:tripartite-type tricarboxylate transporter receptor subunit TctC
MIGLRIAAVLSLLIWATALQAQTVEQFYKQHNLEIVVGSTPNSSYDAWARVLAVHLPKYIPGSPNIIVRNMPGAAGVIAANHLYNIAAKDGSVIGTFSRNIPNMALLGKNEAVKYDPRKFGWLASPEIPIKVCVVLAKTGVKTVEDVMRTEVVMGGTGAGSGPSFLPELLNTVANTKFKVVEGYKGSDDVQLAISRGEVSGICNNYFTIRRQNEELLKSGGLVVLFNLEAKRNPMLGNVPSIVEYIKDPESRQIFSFLTAASDMGRPYAAPPGVPADRMAALKKAFGEVLKDKDFLADATKRDWQPVLTTGEELDALVAGQYSIPTPVRDKAVAMMPEGGLSD